MITYELARKLKENGLEGNFDTDTIILHPDCADMPNNCENSAHSSGDCYIIAQCPPTLEELIDACGDRFKALLVFDNEFEARADEPCDECFSGQPSGLGYTPNEAVANLWLALNEKKDE